MVLKVKDIKKDIEEMDEVVKEMSKLDRGGNNS